MLNMLEHKGVWINNTCAKGWLIPSLPCRLNSHELISRNLPKQISFHEWTLTCPAAVRQLNPLATTVQLFINQPGSSKWPHLDLISDRAEVTSIWGNQNGKHVLLCVVWSSKLHNIGKKPSLFEMPVWKTTPQRRWSKTRVPLGSLPNWHLFMGNIFIWRYLVKIIP